MARLGLPIKFFVLNNEGYASIRATQNNHFDGHLVGSDASSGLTLPDLMKIGAAYGLDHGPHHRQLAAHGRDPRRA